MAKQTKATRARRLYRNGKGIYAIAKALDTQYSYVKAALIRGGLIKA